MADSLCERIDREVFLSLWNTGNFSKMAFARVFYRDAYPHWPEMKVAIDGPA